MDMAKERWLRSVYGDAAVDRMKAKIKDLAAKSGAKSDDPADVVITAFKDALAANPPAYLGDAPTSWEALDAQRAAAAESDRMASVGADYERLSDNIIATLPPADQPAALTALAAGVADRLAAAAQAKAIAADPIVPMMELAFGPGAAQLVIAGAKARRRVTIDDYAAMVTATPARKQLDPWRMAGVAPTGGAR